VAICDYRWGRAHQQCREFVPLSYGDAPVSGLRVKREVFCGTDAECDDDFAFPESGCLGVFSPSVGGTPRETCPSLLPLLPSLTELDLPASMNGYQTGVVLQLRTCPKGGDER